MEPVVRYSLPAREYHANPALGSGAVRTAERRSLAHVRHGLDRVARGDLDSDGSRGFGSLLHAAVLEPDRWIREYRPSPSDRRTRAGKAAHAELVRAGATVVDRDDWFAIAEIVGSIGWHPVASRLVSESEHEVSMFGEITLPSGPDPIRVKARDDMLLVDDRTIADLKTCSDASPGAFSRAIAIYGYHAQAAWYLDVAHACGLAINRFVILAVETKPPWVVTVYEIDAESIEIGRRENARGLARILEAQRTGAWPGYGHAHDEPIQQLGVPYWYAAQQADKAAEWDDGNED